MTASILSDASPHLIAAAVYPTELRVRLKTWPNEVGPVVEVAEPVELTQALGKLPPVTSDDRIRPYFAAV
jgi:hypothetical protein